MRKISTLNPVHYKLGSIFGAALGLGLFAIIWVIGSLHGQATLSDESMHLLAILVLCIVFWITQPIPAEFTALLLMVIPYMLGIVPASIAFSGFTSSTTWFLFGGLIIGRLVVVTGIDKRITLSLMRKIGGKRGNIWRIPIMIFIITFFGTLVIPSGTVLTTLLCAQIFPLIHLYGVDKKSNIGKMLMLLVPILVLINGRHALSGSASNTILWGCLNESGYDVSWLGWFLGNAPVSILMSCFIITVFRITLKPEKAQLENMESVIKTQLDELGEMSAKEKKAMCLFMLALILWITGFVTHISVAAVAVGVAILAMLPIVGVLDFREAVKSCNWAIIIFIAAVMGLPNLMEATGLNDSIYVLFDSFSGHMSSPIAFLAVLWILSQVVGWLGLGIAAPMLFVPFMLPIAMDLGISPVVVVFAQNLMQPCMMFYHSPAPLIASSYGTFEQPNFMKYEFLIMLMYIPVILLMYYTWWPFLQSLGLI